MEYANKFIGQTVEVTVDRPLGSKHPKHGFIYPLNYGFIKETKAPDGEEVDAYILGVSKPVEIFEGQCIAVIHRTNDEDDKLIVVPENSEFTDEEIKKATEFQEKFFTSMIIR